LSWQFCLFLYFLNDWHGMCHHFGSRVIRVNWGCFKSETEIICVRVWVWRAGN
jgi:hypothetical protein